MSWSSEYKNEKENDHNPQSRFRQESIDSSYDHDLSQYDNQLHYYSRVLAALDGTFDIERSGVQLLILHCSLMVCAFTLCSYLTNEQG